MDFLEPEAEAPVGSGGIDFAAELNEEQYAAVTAPIGPSLVLAGAGSGKTRTLTYRVAWLLTQGVKPWEILLLTFTNKAAKEMLQRVEGLTGVGGHYFWGGTFHHIGQKMLRMHGESIGIGKSYNIMDAGDSEAFLGDVIRDVDKNFLKDKQNPKAKVIAEVISFARNTQRTVAEVMEEKYFHFKHLVDSVIAFEREYKARKLKQQVVDYDDLLELWLKLVREDKEVAEKYQSRFKYILVDEYQDTNKLQAAIVNELAKEHQVMAVGDDAQCIYTWRGASFENIMNFPAVHPGTVIHKIETNYRSTPEVLAFANEVLESQPAGQGYEKELRAVRPSGMKPWVVPTMDTRQQAQFIMRRISGLLEEGYRLSDMAVLYRAHYHAMDLQVELSKSQITYQITSGVRFFEQAHVRDLVAMLRFVCNEGDTIAFTRFTGLLPKVGPKTSERLRKLCVEYAGKHGVSFYKAMEAEAIQKKVPEAARGDWLDIAYTLQDVHGGLLEGEKPAVLMTILMDGWYGDYMRNVYPNWRSRMDDLEGVVGFADRYEDVSELLAQLVLLNSETSDRSADLSEDALKLTTVHQAKGLEFPVVFVIGAAQNLFPIKRAVEADDLEEERRLFYVAVTRAKDQLYLAYPRVTMQGGPPTMLEPSQFIEEVSEERYETLHVPGYYGR